VPPCHACPHYVNAICELPRSDQARSAACCVGVQPPRDDSQFTALFQQYQRYVIAWACRITGSYEAATDLAQDVFIKVWNGIAAFRGDARLTTWLYTVTANSCRDYMRARAARPREVDDRALLSSPPVVQNEALAEIEAQQKAMLVRRLMRDAKLNRTEARAFRLHYGADLPLPAVTVRLGLKNPSGARARILSAKRKLRRSAARWQRVAELSESRAARADYVVHGFGR
jgi:RNA polymerase sigma-70 factor, ECF subfamily